jgi:hypothetical protein
MKKVIGGIAGLFFAVFCIGVIGLMVSLTYSALGRIFPNDFENQMWGLVIFDIATLAWAFAFVYKSHSVGQYVASGAGFLVGQIGTLGMIAAEVTLSGQNLTGGSVDLGQIGQWMVYGFIACTALHVILVYAHHAAGPELAQQISTGISRGQIRDRAIHDAEKQLEVETAALARDITADIVASVRRDLQLPIPADPRMPFLPAENYQPVIVPQAEKPQSFFDRLRWKFGKKEQTVPQTTMGTVSVENANETWGGRNGAIMGWRDTPAGRVRLWCLACRDHGATSWATPEPCEHILNAKQEEQISTEEALRTRDELLMEYAKSSEPSYHPVPLEPKAEPKTYRDLARGQKPE